MDNTKEFVVAIGLIVGGTETQPIHYDVAETPQNKKDYKKVMGMHNPPAGLLVGFGHPVRLGVPKEKTRHIVLTEQGEMKCSVDGAIAEDKFLVVSQEICNYRKVDSTTETTNVTVLEAKCGFRFKGDFKHAGASMVLTPGEQEYDIWSKVQKALRPLIFDATKLKDAWHLNNTFTKLCNVQWLNKITRLHVQLCPILQKGQTFRITNNTVAYETDDPETVVVARRNNQGDDNDD